MSINRTAKGIVLVPSLLLGGAFLAAGTWMEGAAAANRPLAFTLGGVLVAAGLLTQLLPESQNEGSTLDEPEQDTAAGPGGGTGTPGGSAGKDGGNAGKLVGTAAKGGGGAQPS